MSELIEMLVTRNQSAFPGGIDERQTFTPAAAPPADVEIDALAPGQGLLRPADSLNYKIAPKDNITVLSMGVSMPYNFTLSSRIIHVQFVWSDGVGGSGVLNIGQAGVIELPFANYELSIGNYIGWPALLVKYHIFMILTSAPATAQDRNRISMIGSPAMLIGVSMPITCFVKISHNLPLIA